MRIEQTKAQIQKSNYRTIEKIQQCIFNRQQDLENEQKKNKEYLKQFNKYEKNVREKNFELDEQKKSAIKMQELIDKLQVKIKAHKKQLEEAVKKKFFLLN